MTVRINARDHFESWVVDLPAATVYMEVYNPPQNGFAAKHLYRQSEDGIAESLQSRNLKNVSSAEDLGDKMLAYNLTLKATKDEPKKKTTTNSMIDCSLVNEKRLAALFADAILDNVGVDGDNKYYDHIEVDLGAPCVISVGKHAGLSGKVKIGGTKVSTSNKAGKTYLSFELSHCGGGA